MSARRVVGAPRAVSAGPAIGAPLAALVRLACAAALTLVTTASSAAAQAHGADHPSASGAGLAVGAMAVGVVSRAAPVVDGATILEGYLTQPMLLATARWWGGRVQALGTLNLEGLTLRRGEIGPGVYGESYVDRRHPHTYLHEAMLGVAGRQGPAGWSLFAGRGFVPFGTDDPMVRPFVKYPVNHHHSQILERHLVVAAARVGAVAVEAARFNGDEPESATDWPNRGRALDSWAARGTWNVTPALEGSASLARVRSPEFAPGGGLDQRKWNVALRLQRPTLARGLRYALVEVARTAEYSGDRRAFVFRTVLAEGEFTRGDASLALRFERTERPEEQRTSSPYRTVRPLLDFGILGKTRWDVASARFASPTVALSAIRLRPFVEVAWHHPVAQHLPTPYDPREVYGGDRLWMVSAGVRLHAGAMRLRFGRYGVSTVSGV